MGFQVVLVVKNLFANAGDLRHTGSILESGRSPGERNGSPFQYSCLENPMDTVTIELVDRILVRTEQCH